MLGRLSCESVTSVGGRFALQDNGETPDTQDALFEFERPASRERFTAVWSHREASAGPPSQLRPEFYGTQGMLGINRKGFTIVPDAKVPPANACRSSPARIRSADRRA